MEMIYDVFLGKEPAGKVMVKIQGLYYCFDCICSIKKGEICRLVVSCGDKTESLGVCVPRGNTFGLETRLPLKRLGRGDLSFKIISNEESQNGLFIRIHEDTPFDYISKLDNACLVFADGNYGICIKEVQDQEIYSTLHSSSRSSVSADMVTDIASPILPPSA